VSFFPAAIRTGKTTVPIAEFVWCGWDIVSPVPSAAGEDAIKRER